MPAIIFLVEQLLTVNLGGNEVRKQVVARIFFALLHQSLGIVGHPVEGGKVLFRLLAGDRIGLNHQHGIVAHLFSSLARQGEEVEQQINSNLTAKIVDEVEGVKIADTCQMLGASGAGRLQHMVKRAFRHSGLDQGAQAIMPWRIRAAER